MPFLLTEISNFQGSTHLIGVGSFSKKLFKLMIDKDIKKKELKVMASIGNSTMAKLRNNENVTMEVLAKIGHFAIIKYLRLNYLTNL